MQIPGEGEFFYPSGFSAFMKWEAIVVGLVSMLSIATAAGEDCQFGFQPDLSFEGYYVDADMCAPSCVVSVWVYEESNGIEGIQRDDPGRSDICEGIVPDSLVIGTYSRGAEL